MCEWCRERDQEGKAVTLVKKKIVSGRQITLWKVQNRIYSPEYRVTISEPNPRSQGHYTYDKKGGTHRKINNENRKDWKAERDYNNVNEKTLEKALKMFQLWDDFWIIKKEVNALLEGKTERSERDFCPACGHGITKKVAISNEVSKA